MKKHHFNENNKKEKDNYLLKKSYRYDKYEQIK